MSKFWMISICSLMMLVPISVLKMEQGRSFALINIYEVLEFSCYFVSVYLMILAKVFEALNISRSRVIL